MKIILKLEYMEKMLELKWRQEDPNYLSYTKFGSPAQNITRGSNITSDEAKNVTRIPPRSSRRLFRRFCQYL